MSFIPDYDINNLYIQNNQKDKEINKLKENQKEKEIKKLKNNQNDNEKLKIAQKDNEIEKLKKEIIKKNNENSSLKDENQMLKNENQRLKSELNNNKQNLEAYKLEMNKLNLTLTNKINEINNLNNEIKNLQLSIKKLVDIDELLTIEIKSIDETVDMPFTCQKNDIFVRIEEKLYKEYPQYKDLNTYFTVNGHSVEKYKTMIDNKIRNNDKIFLNINELQK